MSRFRLDRRTFLRGMLGGAAVTIGLPALNIFLNDNGTAYGAASSFPKRFGLFFWGNGVLPAKWNPAGTGAGYTLSEQLQGLAGVKDLVTVVSGMGVKVPNVEPHGAGAAGILSGAPLLLEGDHRTFTAPSIDQIIANEVGGYSRFRSLEFGAFPGDGLSYNGPDNKNPPENLPLALFDRVFGGGFTIGPPGVPDPKLALRQSVLDAVQEDVAALEKRLGQADKERLDQHLSGLRDLEKRIVYLYENPPNLAACAIPAQPLASYPDVNGRPQISAINRAFIDVLVMILACDQTRVFSNFMTSPVNNLLWPSAPSGHHQLTHDEAGDQPQVNAIVKQIVAEYAYLVEKLQGVPEGAGTLLDNCLVLGTTDCSLGRTHSLDDFPILLAGSAGGVIKQGIHYRSTSSENASKLLLTIVQAFDIPAASFGAKEGLATSDLGAILV